MARAGFYAIESGAISFRRDGNWYSDDERIDNPRIALLFSKSLRRGADGAFFLEVGEERAPVTVEDAPYVVRTVEDDGRGGLVLVLNDDSREALDPESLEVGPHNVLYTRVKDGSFTARFLRTAYYHLSDRIEQDSTGRFVLKFGAKRHPLRCHGQRTQ